MVAVKLVVWVCRRVYRYPLLIITSVGLAWAYLSVGRDWVAPALLVAWLVALGGSWWLLHPASFERFCWRQVRSEYRRLRVYAFRWTRTMIGAAAHEIPESTPGVAWVKVDGQLDPDRVRAFHVTDADLDELTAYVTAPVVVDGTAGTAEAAPVRQLVIPGRGGDAA